MIHNLKTWPVLFADVVSGAKTFEVRIDDRGYQVGDILCLKEYKPNLTDKGVEGGVYTGGEINVRVMYTIHLGHMPDMPDKLIGMVIEEYE
jgi:hypothetical protein